MNYPPPVPGLLLAGGIALLLCAVLAWTFVIRYFRRRWWETPEGRHLLRFTVILASTFTLTLVFAVVPLPPILEAVVQLVVFLAMAAELWHRNLLLTAAQHRRLAVPDAPDHPLPADLQTGVKD